MTGSAKQRRNAKSWIASSQVLLAMTGVDFLEKNGK
jgi:hypothetical protein